MSNNNIKVENCEGLELLQKINNKTIDLILTDPPYIISKESGMNILYDKIHSNNISIIKTEDEWNIYKKENNINSENDKQKQNYLKYGSIYGRKYSVKSKFGEWDENFTINILEKFIEQYYNKLKNGGTLIIFFDLWKITILKDLLEKYKFKQIRFIEWIKTNPQPRNSSINYLTNCREIALLAIKGSNPTFNSKYDNGIYNYPICGGKGKFHPTQKNLSLFEDLIKKHSNKNDTVLDTFLGSGTTLYACINTNRNFIGCEVNKEYFDKINY